MSRRKLRVVRSEPAVPESEPSEPIEAPEVVDVRFDLIMRVRREIAAGEYETQQKLEAAVARMVASGAMS